MRLAKKSAECERPLSRVVEPDERSGERQLLGGERLSERFCERLSERLGECR
jgi:hypothetical protein